MTESPPMTQAEYERQLAGLHELRARLIRNLRNYQEDLEITDRDIAQLTRDYQEGLGRS
jgi:hypothetical protein